MKRIVMLILVSFLSFAYAHAQNDVSQKIMQSFQKSASKDFLIYFSNKVETHILNDDDIFSKEQAVAILEKFFKDYPIKKVSNLHDSKSKNDTKFIVADVVAGNSNFRMSMLIKKTDEQLLIHQFRIESSND
jgi:hypothetical protein